MLQQYGFCYTTKWLVVLAASTMLLLISQSKLTVAGFSIGQKVLVSNNRRVISRNKIDGTLLFRFSHQGDEQQQQQQQQRNDAANDHHSPPSRQRPIQNSSPPSSRRSLFQQGTRTAASVVAAAITTAATITATPQEAGAIITQDSQYPLWLSLPVAPYSRRRTIRKEIVSKQVWTFDQLIGIYYVHVPIRMTVVAINQPQSIKKRRGAKPTTSTNNNGLLPGLLVYAPVAPTKECIDLVQDLVDQYGPVQHIILPSVAVEHKVLAGPFARQFPNANFFIVERQYSFPVGLPNLFLGLPSWAKPLPEANHDTTHKNAHNDESLFGPDIDYDILTVQPGPGSMLQDVALLHKPSKTMLVCDAVLAVTAEPPAILTEEPEYTRALLFHARDNPNDMPADTPENRRKGWRRIVLLFNFFFPGAGTANLGLRPVARALQTPLNPYGWGGWMPFQWESPQAEMVDFETYSNGGKPTLLPIIQIILARGPDAVKQWLATIQTWKFDRVIPAHLDAPLAIGPKQFAEVFDFIQKGKSEVRFCDEDVTFLRQAEEGFLGFSVFPSSLGALRGASGPCGLAEMKMKPKKI